VPVQLDLERVNSKLRLEAPRGLSVDLPSPAEMPAAGEAPAAPLDATAPATQSAGRGGFGPR
jgi:hypothetical protein